jgi:hypothetical protein
MTMSKNICLFFDEFLKRFSPEILKLFEYGFWTLWDIRIKKPDKSIPPEFPRSKRYKELHRCCLNLQEKINYASKWCGELRLPKSFFINDTGSIISKV